MAWNGYIGLDNGKFRLFINQGALNQVGTRLEKGRSLPDSVYATANGTPTPAEITEALKDFQQWLDSDPQWNKKKPKK